MTGGDWKVSHRNKWKWHIAITSERAEAGGVDRVTVVEGRYQPERGWSEGAGLLIPCGYLRGSEETLKPSVLQIPTSLGHSCIRIWLLFEEPGAVGIRFGHGLLVVLLHHQRRA